MSVFNKKNLILGIIILLLLLVVIYSGLRILEPAVVSTSDDVSGKTIERDGVQYFPRQDITVFLFMFIDTEGVVQESVSYKNDGECDVVALAVFDESDKTYSILCLNRDTMLDMNVLGVGGKTAGTVNAQLALSHTYGSGMEDSCENTRNAVSDFLYGLNIEYYVSLNMDSLAILNDSVGGVKVNVTDDFSEIDPTIPMGETVLRGDQALTYVRTRKGLGDQMNITRMTRHEEYMRGFFSALRGKLDDTSFALSAFNSVSDYMVTDCSVETLSSYANRYSDYTLKEIVSPEGENVKGKEYMEFHVDAEKLDELILRLFYSPKK